MENKIKFIRARVTEKEYEEIKKKARKAKMNMSNYITLSTLGREIIVIEDLKDMVHNVAKIGNNINQLTVLAHTKRINVVDLKGFKEELNNMWQILNELTKDTGKRK